MPVKSPIEMTVVYDNNPYDNNLRTDWGFSCFVSGLSKTLLFDTGKDGQILLSNMKKLDIDPRSVEVVILSHEHRDHTSGLSAFLKERPGIEVWVPYFFGPSFREKVNNEGGRFVKVNSFQNICEGATTTGVIQGWIKEQSLVVETPRGLVLMTGCAHPRIINVIDRVRELWGKDIYLAMGGFHLVGFPAREIREIIVHFRKIGVKKAGPCHCSGDEARKLFELEYGRDFVQVGIGRRIQVQ